MALQPERDPIMGDGTLTEGQPAFLIRAILASAICATVVLLTNNVGFFGGGQDDGRYLEAARCWEAYGPCLPTNHWQARWPVFAPSAGLAVFFGESRLVVAIWPVIASVSALVLTGLLAKRLCSTNAGLLSIVLLASTPAFATQFATSSVEAIELSFILASALAIIRWNETKSPAWALAIGLFLGLACEVRETAILSSLMLISALLICGVRPTFKGLLLAATGFAIPVAIELSVYWYATGDPFYRAWLSLNHGRIPSSELSPLVDTTKTPILNPEFIAGWRREPGLRVHWLVDGPINLLANSKAGYAAVMAPVLLWWARRIGELKDQRRVIALIVGAAIQIFCITYVLAMDPKPRVFLPALVALNIALAILVTDLWKRNRNRLVLAVLMLSFVLSGWVTLFAYIRPALAQHQAEEWTQIYGPTVETDKVTRNMLALSPVSASLAKLGSHKKYAMIVTRNQCKDWIVRGGLSNDQIAVSGASSLTILSRKSDEGAWICLFRYRSQIDGGVMEEAAGRNWRLPQPENISALRKDIRN